MQLLAIILDVNLFFGRECSSAIESLNMSLRKAIKTHGALPSEDAALKVMYLALYGFPLISTTLSPRGYS